MLELFACVDSLRYKVLIASTPYFPSQAWLICQGVIVVSGLSGLVKVLIVVVVADV